MKYFRQSIVLIIVLFSCRSVITRQLKTSKTGNSVSDNYTNYKTGRIFQYGVEQILVKDTLSFKLRAHVIPQKRLKGALIEFHYFYDIQTINHYFYQGRLDTTSNTLRVERTSFKDGDWVFFHPPRAYTLESLQLAPFPQFVKTSLQSSGTLSIPKGNWGYWENSKIKCTNSIDSIHYSIDSIPLKYFISSEASSVYGKNAAYFVYDIDSGFVKMNYQFENGNSVRITLESITER
jgi:hypothetical protein